LPFDYTALYNRRMSDMRRHWFFILLSLAERDRHGSGIVRDVLELTGGELRLWPVTLYGSLDELRENSWIRELDQAPERGEDRGHRRWFRITPQGRRALVAEMQHMQSLVAVAQRRLAGAGDPS
jgi:DNA-binding PadR family transcriptional regulator